jgi:hypothetical protein
VVVGILAVAPLALCTGVASAAAPAGPQVSERMPDHAVQVVCGHLGDALDGLPPHSTPAQVCTLVNGWD